MIYYQLWWNCFRQCYSPNVCNGVHVHTRSLYSCTIVAAALRIVSRMEADLGREGRPIYRKTQLTAVIFWHYWVLYPNVRRQIKLTCILWFGCPCAFAQWCHPSQCIGVSLSDKIQVSPLIWFTGASTWGAPFRNMVACFWMECWGEFLSGGREISGSY